MEWKLRHKIAYPIAGVLCFIGWALTDPVTCLVAILVALIVK